MKILITGALGHIGSYLINELVKIKNIKKIYLIDNISNQRFPVIFRLKNKKVHFIYGDLTSEKIINKIPKTNIVIHLASITDAEGSFNIKQKIFKNNIGSFKNILKYCLKYKSKLIHISSTSVYGQQENLVTEKEKNLFPQSPYAKIKLKEETILKIQNKIKYITLRFGTISGFSEGMRFHTAVNKFCFNSINKLPIPIWGNALNLYRPYLSLYDAAKVIKFIIKNKYFPNDIFNVLSENKTVKQILSEIKKNKIKIKLKFVNSKIKNYFSFITSKNKIEKLGLKLNAKISKDIKDTLKNLKHF